MLVARPAVDCWDVVASRTGWISYEQERLASAIGEAIFFHPFGTLSWEDCNDTVRQALHTILLRISEAEVPTMVGAVDCNRGERYSIGVFFRDIDDPSGISTDFVVEFECWQAERGDVTLAIWSTEVEERRWGLQNAGAFESLSHWIRSEINTRL